MTPEKPTRRFLQLDAFADGACAIDYDEHIDDDGDVLYAGVAVDPQFSPTVVRVRIDPSAKPAVVLRHLRKLTEWYEREGDRLILRCGPLDDTP